jgi:hypothetical protein
MNHQDSHIQAASHAWYIRQALPATRAHDRLTALGRINVIREVQTVLRSRNLFNILVKTEELLVCAFLVEVEVFRGD